MVSRVSCVWALPPVSWVQYTSDVCYGLPCGGGWDGKSWFWFQLGTEVISETWVRDSKLGGWQKKLSILHPTPIQYLQKLLSCVGFLKPFNVLDEEILWLAFHLRKKIHETDEAVCPVVTAIPLQSLSCEGLTGGWHDKDVCLECCQLCHTHTTQVSLKEWYLQHKNMYATWYTSSMCISDMQYMLAYGYKCVGAWSVGNIRKECWQCGHIMWLPLLNTVTLQHYK